MFWEGINRHVSGLVFIAQLRQEMAQLTYVHINAWMKQGKTNHKVQTYLWLRAAWILVYYRTTPCPFLFLFFFFSDVVRPNPDWLFKNLITILVWSALLAPCNALFAKSALFTINYIDYRSKTKNFIVVNEGKTLKISKSSRGFRPWLVLP
jgi:hypothetical protein